MKRVWAIYFVVLVSTILLVSPIAYLISYALSEQHAGDAISTLLTQYYQVKRNPLITSLLSLFPFLLLAIIQGIAQKRKTHVKTCTAMVTGGSLAIFVLMMWANLTYWPNFLPEVQYPGFPHGLELVIVPLFFAPIGMLLGVLLGWFAGRNTLKQ